MLGADDAKRRIEDRLEIRLLALTNRPSLHAQLPDDLFIGLRVNVAHVARCFLVAVVGVHTNEVGARAGGDAAARDRHAAWRSVPSLLKSPIAARSGWRAAGPLLDGREEK